MLFYADRKDRAGNRLITSYGKKAQAEKYGGANATITSQERRIDIDQSGNAIVGEKGMLLRTLMTRAPGSGETSKDGKFVVFGKNNGVWERTSFRYSTYALANQAVKSALINLFEACAVVELENDEYTEENEDVPMEDNTPWTV